MWLAPLAGGMAGLALPPLGWPWLLWIALVPLWRLSWRGGALWGAAAVLVSHRWLLALHPLDWLGVPALLSAPLVVTLWLICGAAAALLVGLWCALVQRAGPARLSTAFSAAWLWALVELLLAKGPLFWIGLGVAPLPGDRWLAGLAWFGGAPLLAALQLLISWLLWRLRWRALLLVLVVAHGLGAAALAAVPTVGAAGQELSVVVGQPNLPTREKFSAQQQQRQRQLLIRAMAVAEQQGADAVVLPEGALPLGQALPAMPAPLLSGGFRRQELDERSSVLWFPAGSTRPQKWIDKQRLVPLGEWVPGGLAGLSAVGGVSPGEAPRLLELPPPLGPVAVAICYELSDGLGLNQAVRDGAGWLLTIANLDPYPLALQQQFKALAQLRAIETSRWLLSSANTGPSALVSPRGELQQQLPANQEALGLMQLPALRGESLWTRLGLWPQLLLWLGFLSRTCFSTDESQSP
ncbi:MAG: nitrilase-related carbon-nitrogen hydrolase [Synechococcus sp.]